MTPYRTPAPPQRPSTVAPPRDTLGAIARLGIGLFVLAVWVRAWVVLSWIIGDMLAILES